LLIPTHCLMAAAPYQAYKSMTLRRPDKAFTPSSGNPRRIRKPAWCRYAYQAYKSMSLRRPDTALTPPSGNPHRVCKLPDGAALIRPTKSCHSVGRIRRLRRHPAILTGPENLPDAATLIRPTKACHSVGRIRRLRRHPAIRTGSEDLPDGATLIRPTKAW